MSVLGEETRSMDLGTLLSRDALSRDASDPLLQPTLDAGYLDRTVQFFAELSHDTDRITGTRRSPSPACVVLLQPLAAAARHPWTTQLLGVP